MSKNRINRTYFELIDGSFGLILLVPGVCLEHVWGLVYGSESHFGCLQAVVGRDFVQEGVGLRLQVEVAADVVQAIGEEQPWRA